MLFSTSWRLLSWAGVVCFAAVLAVMPATPISLGRARTPPLVIDEPITPVPEAPAADPARLALGDSLFHDPRLSADGTRSCGSCHDIGTNGADGRAHDRAPDGRPVAVTTNTVFNAALSFRLNWAGTARSLEEQAEWAIARPDIMAYSVDRAVAALRADPATVRRFERAYGHGPDRASLLDAIATYERSLVTPGSRFDQYLEGDATAITAQEQAGYALFKSLGCIACHQGVNVGGNLYERHGIFAPVASESPEVLRVPSLRNVAVTAPYFHDGSAPKLNGVVSTMARGQLGRDLTTEQVDLIVAFLGTLTGRYQGRPLSQAP